MIRNVITQRDTSDNIGQTIRQPSTALLCIDSEDRWKDYEQRRFSSPGSYNFSPYNFTITKKESIMNGFFTRIGVTEVVFPWFVPNINKASNKIYFAYNIGAGQVDGVLIFEQGFYDPVNFATIFQEAVKDAAGGDLDDFTCEYDQINGLGGQFKYSTNDPTKYISFDSMAYDPDPTSPGYYPFGDGTKQLFDMMAFGTSNMALQNTLTFGGFTFLQYTRYVDIVCSILTYNQALKDTMSQPVARDTLCRVYLGNEFRRDIYETATEKDVTIFPPGTYPTILYANFSMPKQIQWQPNQPVPSGLQFQVYDDNGNILDSLFDITTINGATGVPEADWSMTLLVSEN